MNTSFFRRLLAGLTVSAAALAPSAQAAAFDFWLLDPEGFGFNDATPVQPVGGNPGTTLGDQRMNVLMRAFDIWAPLLDSPVLITVALRTNRDGCTTLASARPSNLFTFNSDPATFIPQALVEKRIGRPVYPYTSPDNLSIQVAVNDELNSAACGPQAIYLGLDGQAPAGSNNLLATFLHELAHGLGFGPTTNLATGVPINNAFSIWERQLFDNTTGLPWTQLSNAQRAAAAVTFRSVTWRGQNVVSAVPQVLKKGMPELRVIAPGFGGFNPELVVPEVGNQIDNYTSFSSNLTRVVDQSNGTGLACSPLTGANRNNANGRLVIVDRGECALADKFFNVQNAGAMGLILVNNTADTPPDIRGTLPGLTIPVVFISQADGARLKQGVPNPASGPYTTLRTNPSRYFGADRLGYPLMHTPTPLRTGTSLAHFDISARVNLLMEPINNGAGEPASPAAPFDLTLAALRDLGW